MWFLSEIDIQKKYNSWNILKIYQKELLCNFFAAIVFFLLFCFSFLHLYLEETLKKEECLCSISQKMNNCTCSWEQQILESKYSNTKTSIRTIEKNASFFQYHGFTYIIVAFMWLRYLISNLTLLNKSI